MLRLWREHGGNAWLRRFCRILWECPEAPAEAREGALQQCWNWYLAASLAAQRDLSSVFVGDWRMPLTEEVRKAVAAVDWRQPDLTPVMVDRRVRAITANICAEP